LTHKFILNVTLVRDSLQTGSFESDLYKSKMFLVFGENNPNCFKSKTNNFVSKKETLQVLSV